VHGISLALSTASSFLQPNLSFFNDRAGRGVPLCVFDTSEDAATAPMR
jgi:hypothetical protein